MIDSFFISSITCPISNNPARELCIKPNQEFNPLLAGLFVVMLKRTGNCKVFMPAYYATIKGSA